MNTSLSNNTAPRSYLPPPPSSSSKLPARTGKGLAPHPSSLSVFDTLIPDTVFESNPDAKRHLERIDALESDIDHQLRKKLRFGLAFEATPAKIGKILRVYLNHTYVPPFSDGEEAHFNISLEGHLLDKKLQYANAFGSFFERIRFELDKALNPSNIDLDWTGNVQGGVHGFLADCFTAKVPIPAGAILPPSTDGQPQSFSLVVYLQRHSASSSALAGNCPHYELSAPLRKILPYLSVDPTEDEVYEAFWEYCVSKNLVSFTNSQIKCDPTLKSLFGVESLTVGSLRSKLISQLVPSRPIRIEYKLTLPHPLTGLKGGLVGGGGLGGGVGVGGASKNSSFVMDLRVEAFDPFAGELVQQLNILTDVARESHESILSMHPMAHLLARRIAEQQEKVSALEAIAIDPIKFAGSPDDVTVFVKPVSIHDNDNDNQNDDDGNGNGNGNDKLVKAEEGGVNAMDVEGVQDNKIQNDQSCPMGDTGAVRGIATSLPFLRGFYTDITLLLAQRKTDRERERERDGGASSGVGGVSGGGSSSNNKRDEENTTKPPHNVSAVHLYRGFIDLGDDRTFKGDQRWINQTVQLELKHKEETDK